MKIFRIVFCIAGFIFAVEFQVYSKEFNCDSNQMVEIYLKMQEKVTDEKSIREFSKYSKCGFPEYEEIKEQFKLYYKINFGVYEENTDEELISKNDENRCGLILLKSWDTLIKGSNDSNKMDYLNSYNILEEIKKDKINCNHIDGSEIQKIKDKLEIIIFRYGLDISLKNNDKKTFKFLKHKFSQGSIYGDIKFKKEYSNSINMIIQDAEYIGFSELNEEEKCI